VDLDTSELVEKTTYSAYGTTESDYRPERWGHFREDYKFTGKEEDIEVGLSYFGYRYYAPTLGRWLSADPLAVHSPGQADGRVATLGDITPRRLGPLPLPRGFSFHTPTRRMHSTYSSVAHGDRTHNNGPLPFPSSAQRVASSPYEAAILPRVRHRTGKPLAAPMNAP
jgi:RHS repeat-associated protein